MTDVLYFGSDSCMPLSENYVKSNSYIQKLLFVDKKKYEEKTKNSDDTAGWQTLIHLVKTDRENILAKDKFYSVSCGSKYTILVNTEGILWGFGHSSRKHLFQGSFSSGNVPTKLTLSAEQRYMSIACGDNHFVAITTNQMPYAWGDAGQGRLIVNGEPSTVHARQIHLENFTKVIESDSKSHFKKVYYAPEASQLPVDDRFTSLDSFACGPDNTFFVINSKVFAAGKGNLGVGATNIISNEYLQETGPTPFILYNLFRYKIKGVSAGKAHALAWDVEGFLYSWGDPEYGKLGHPVDSETLFEKEILPKKVKSLEDERIVQAACGYRHSVALTNTGHIYMWGNCESVEKGTPMRENTLSFANIRPKKLEVAGSKPEDSHVVFVKVTAGAYHNAAIDKNGRLYTWGDSSSGCLGHEKTNDRAVPTLITAIKHKKVIDVACGEKFTVAIVSSKDAKIVSKCLEEFTQNSIKTFQERLKAINEFNYKKKKFRIDKKKKELSYAPPEEIKIPITKMSQKNITDELTKYYIQKSTETNPKNRDKLDFKVPFLSASKVIEDLMDIHNTSASDKHKESSSSFIKPPSMTKIDPVSSRDEEDQPSNSQRRKPKRGLTISPEFRFAGNKNSDDYYGPGSASKTSYSPQKQFFTTPKRPEPKRSITSIQNPPNISYVFDAVTEHLNEKSDYYNEFKSALKNKQSDEPGQTNSHRQFDVKAGQTVKQAETEMNRKGHVRRSDFDFISNSKVITKSRPQTAKSVQPGRFDFRPSTAKSIQQSRIEFTSPKMASVATSNFYGSQLARPFSSCTTNSSPLRVKVKRSEGFKEYDHLKALELEKRNEDFENRSKVIAERKTLQIQEIAAERDFKIRMVQEKKAYLQQEKKQKIADMTYKRSPEFKNILEHVKGRKIEIEHLQKYFIGLIGCQHLAYTMMLVIKQAHNKLYMTRIRNTMAGKIQKAWKKHKIIQRVNLLTDKQKNIIRIMLMKYVLKRKRILKAKRLRKVYLMFQYQNMSKKIAQKLLALRNMIIPIQKFVQWSRRIFRLRFRKLALAWDVNMMRLTNIKVEENKLLSAAVGKLNSIEHNSPAKVTTKVELNMNKQKRAIDMEITSLGLNKKDAGKKAGDIKTRMEVIMDHMKLRGALLSLGDDDHQKQQQHQQQLQVHQPHQAGSHGPRKSVIDGRSSHGKLELIVSYESIVRETILAYSVHDNEITFAAQYLVKKDSGSTHEKILPRLVQFEIQLKMKILREIYEDRLMSYEKSIKDYEWQLKDFMIKNRKDIDLERTRLMLSTPKETLRAISRKEETEFRMENVNTNSNKRRPLNQLGLGEKDHLPFAKLKIKIAAAMHDAPKFPSYKTGITFEEFKVYFKRFYEEYRTGYAQIIQAARLKGRVAYKG